MDRIRISGTFPGRIILLLALFAAFPALAQSRTRLGAPIIESGAPTGADGGWRDDFGRRDDRDRYDVHRDRISTSRRYDFDYDELPPPPGRNGSFDDELPAPRFGAAPRASILSDRRPKSFVADYIFLAGSDVKATGAEATIHEVEMVWQFRIPVRERWMLTLRPLIDATFIAGPLGVNPAASEALYKAMVDVQADFRFDDHLGLSIAVTPGLWTDFKRVSGDDFRIPARALLTLRVGDGLFLAGGVIYTDNFRRNLLPAVGAIWDLNDRWRLELLFPRSRLIFRPVEQWQLYAVVERGGDTWFIHDEVPGVYEKFEYRDIRIMGGVQTDGLDWISVFAEAGVSLDRRFRFQTQGEFELENTLAIRAGIRF
jgi:hypothetical protein